MLNAHSKSKNNKNKSIKQNNSRGFSNPFELIQESMNIGKKYFGIKTNPYDLGKEEEEPKYAYEFIPVVMEKTREDYLNNISNITYTKAERVFRENITKLSLRTKAIIEKNSRNLIMRKKEIEKILKDTEKKEEVIERELKGKNKEISELQGQFALFNFVKPILEEIIKGIKGKPDKVLDNLNDIRDNCYSQIKELIKLEKEVKNQKIDMND
ncbi:MAG: hypothetical protein MJ252_06655, partial [archaeon]|nr:hypothetical protein [archaeon]